MLDFLNSQELERITRRKKSTAQVNRLKDMKIPHMLDGDGCPLVLRSNIMGLLSGGPVEEKPAADQLNEMLKQKMAKEFNRPRKT